MKRLIEENLNTPDYHSEIWTREGIHNYDSVRMRAFLEDMKPGDSVLDVGCGTYGVSEYALIHRTRSGDFTLCDYSETALAISERRLQEAVIDPNSEWRLFQSDATYIDLPESQFDFVCAGELIEHIEVPQDLLREMVRLCKPGGMVVISTVDTQCEQAKAMTYPDHIWEFTPEDLLTLSKPYGDAKYKTVGNYHFIYLKVHDPKRGRL